VTGVEYDRRSHDEVAGPPHGDMVAQPHSEDEGPVTEAEQLAAKLSSSESRKSDLGLRGVLPRRQCGPSLEVVDIELFRRNRAAVANFHPRLGENG